MKFIEQLKNILSKAKLENVDEIDVKQSRKVVFDQFQPFDQKLRLQLQEKLHQHYEQRHKKFSFPSLFALLSTIAMVGIFILVITLQIQKNTFADTFIDKVLAYYQEQGMQGDIYYQKSRTVATASNVFSMETEDTEWSDAHGNQFSITNILSDSPPGLEHTQQFNLTLIDPITGLRTLYSSQPYFDAVGYQSYLETQKQQMQSVICHQSYSDNYYFFITIPLNEKEPITVYNSYQPNIFSSFENIENLIKGKNPASIAATLKELQNEKKLFYSGLQNVEGKNYETYEISASPSEFDSSFFRDQTVVHLMTWKNIFYFDPTTHALMKNKTIYYLSDGGSTESTTTYLGSAYVNLDPQTIFDPKNYNLFKGYDDFYLEGCYKNRKIMSPEDKNLFFDQLDSERKKELEEKKAEALKVLP